MQIKGIKDIKFFMKGSRGHVYTGKYKNKIVAIKVKNPESEALNKINNEINFLKILNKYDIGPKLIMNFENIMVYEFQEGRFMIEWWKSANDFQKKKVLKRLIKECYIMDSLGINKEEMLRPFKNVVIKKYNIPVLIDFERCHFTKNIKNVSQLIQYMIKEKIVSINIIPFIQEYKNEINKKNYKKICEQIF